MKKDLLHGVRMTRRDALLLSASAGVGLTLPKQLHGLDSTKTAVHQQARICTTPQSAVAKTQYGKVRGYVSGGVYTFKGVPYGQDTAGENRWLPAKAPTPWKDEYPALVYGANCPQTLHNYKSIEMSFLYDWDDGYMSDSTRQALEAFVKRGGGIVSLHDSLCGPDPAYFATLVGGAKKHGEVNYTLGADIPYTIVDKANPIMQGMSDITIFDEAFFTMTWAKDPAIHLLATAIVPGTPSAGTHKGEVAPQIWTYEHTLAGGQPARAFVWMQGHTYANFANPQIQTMLLRGIAWAGKKPVDELVDYKAPVRKATTPY